MLIFQGYNKWWMRRNFLFSFGIKLSREYIKGVFPSTRITRLCSRSSNNVAVILGASRRAVERFFKMCRKGRPLKPTLYLYMIMPSIRTRRLPGYSARKTAYILYINRDGEFVKGESELLNTSNSGV
jgi:hypothetical protein